MTMRSTPPASSHFAERPVPAPPPTIGSPRAAIARNFSISALRSNLGIVTSLRACGRPSAPCSARKAATTAAANSGSLIWRRMRISWRFAVCRTVCSSARNERGVGVGVVERLTDSRRARRRRSSGRRKRTGPSMRFRPLADPSADPIVLGRGVCASASPADCARGGGGPCRPAGTVSGAPKLTMSSAPTEPT